MGQYADDVIDAIMDDPGLYYGAWSYKPRKLTIPKCKRCGKTPLMWQRLPEGWRLHEIVNDELVMHNCSIKDKFDAFQR